MDNPKITYYEIRQLDNVDDPKGEYVVLNDENGNMMTGIESHLDAKELLTQHLFEHGDNGRVIIAIINVEYLYY